MYHMKRPKKITASSLEFWTIIRRDNEGKGTRLESFFSFKLHISDVVLVLVSRPLLMTKENRENKNSTPPSLAEMCIRGKNRLAKKRGKPTSVSVPRPRSSSARRVFLQEKIQNWGKLSHAPDFLDKQQLTAKHIYIRELEGKG